MDLVIRATVVFFFIFLVTRVVGRRQLSRAMCGALLLVATKLFGPSVGAITVLLGALPFLLLWFLLPLRRRAHLDAAAEDRPADES